MGTNMNRPDEKFIELLKLSGSSEKGVALDAPSR